MATRIVDIHAHMLVPAVEALVAERPERAAALRETTEASGSQSAAHNATLFRDVYLPKLTDVGTRLASMDAQGVDMQALSISPTQYYYWADVDLAGEIAQKANTHLAEACEAHPDRFVGLATVTLQHPDLAAEQLTHAVKELGLRGCQISTLIGGAELADPRHDVFWRRAEALGAVVFIHPLGCTLGPRVEPFYLVNVIGQPIETTLALSHLIFGGTLDRHPGLKICAAHGGGYLPSYIGRSDHGFEVRPESRTMKQKPSEYLRQIWFDSLVYTSSGLEHLVREVGASQVVIGTDYPFDMGVEDPLAQIAEADLDETEREMIRGSNACRLLGITDR
ncbi:MAG: amidohydrolase family protein [Gammaproteobacteria bacterium]|nr:amidohydrolase family protein [Gammaproteobacteria bacterium]